MANPYHHAVSSAKRWGGEPEDYLEIHEWFDASKEIHGDFRHRMLRHHAQGIYECQRTFGTTITLTAPCSACDETGAAATDSLGGHGICAVCKGAKKGPHGREIPVRWIGEQHVVEDIGYIPSFSDWCRALQAEPWMNRSRPLSRELEREESRA